MPLIIVINGAFNSINGLGEQSRLMGFIVVIPVL
jgi:hypothetical protein